MSIKIDKSGRRSDNSRRKREEPEGEVRRRLAPADRRAQLLRVAGSILTEAGAEGVQITELAARAGVSRPVVYRFFSNREDILVGVLEDFELELNRRFIEWSHRIAPGADLGGIAEAFMEAVCDSIEDRGAGPWTLLGATGLDDTINQTAAAIRGRLTQPWKRPIRRVTGAPEGDVAALAEVLTSAVRATMDLWIREQLGRKRAIRMASRTINAVLTEFGSNDV